MVSWVCSNWNGTHMRTSFSFSLSSPFSDFTAISYVNVCHSNRFVCVFLSSPPVYFFLFSFSILLFSSPKCFMRHKMTMSCDWTEFSTSRSKCSNSSDHFDSPPHFDWCEYSWVKFKCCSDWNVWQERERILEVLKKKTSFSRKPWEDQKYEDERRRKRRKIAQWFKGNFLILYYNIIVMIASTRYLSLSLPLFPSLWLSESRNSWMSIFIYLF